VSKSLSKDTITNATSSPTVLYKESILGISAIHGGHHVAQRFIKITFPFNSCSEVTLPFTSMSLKFISALGPIGVGLVVLLDFIWVTSSTSGFINPVASKPR